MPVTDDDKRWCVRRAIHTMSGAEGRWSKLRETGAADEALTAAIRYEFGDIGGFSASGYPTVGYHASGPLVAIGALHPHNAECVIRGRELLRMVREITGVKPPRPPEVQLSLF